MAISRFKTSSLTTQTPKYGNINTNLVPFIQLGGNSFAMILRPTAFGIQDIYANSIAIDSSDNIYFGGYARPTGLNSSPFIMKIVPSTGEIEWTRYVTPVSSDAYAYRDNIAVDSSSNVYIAWLDSGNNTGYISKYNSSGTLIASRSFKQTGGYPNTMGVSVDNTNGRVMVSGYGGFTGTLDCSFIIAFNTSTMDSVWFYRYGNSNNANYFRATDAYNGIVYTCGASYESPGGPLFQRINTSDGTTGERRILDATDAANGNFADVFVAQSGSGAGQPLFSGSVYGQSEASVYEGIIRQTDSTLGLAFARRIRIPSISITCKAGTVDSSGNVYAFLESGTNYYLVKWNSSGTVQWTRKITTNFDIGVSETVRIRAYGTQILITGSSSSTPNYYGALVISLPQDGSYTGTFSLGALTTDLLIYTYTVSNASSDLTIIDETMGTSVISLNANNTSTSATTVTLSSNTSTIATKLYTR
jgi:hypothetical protein